jgi:hypothetical protein
MKQKHPLFIMLLAGLFCACESTNTKEQQAESQTVSYAPVDKGNGLYAFDFHNVYFEADAANGGRIRAFSYEGKNMLSAASVNAINWGTSLWPSPQSAWGWPPSQTLDAAPYNGGIKDDKTIELISEKDSLLGYVFTKTYQSSPQDTAILVTYTIANNSDRTQSVAPWEISRVAPGGLTLYPTGKGAKQHLLAGLTEDKNGITWFQYDFDKVQFKSSEVPKLIHDGAEGWLAQVNDGILMVKKFEDIPVEKTAPEEGEIEFYANPDQSYIEIEQQGPYTSLEPGQSLRWEVKWYLRKLPEGIVAEAGSESLAAYIRNLVK